MGLPVPCAGPAARLVGPRPLSALARPGPPRSARHAVRRRRRAFCHRARDTKVRGKPVTGWRWGCPCAGPAARLVGPPPDFRPRAPRASSPGSARRTPSPSGLLPAHAGHQGAWPRGRNSRGRPVLAGLRSPACPARPRARSSPVLAPPGRLRPARCACPDRAYVDSDGVTDGAFVYDSVCARSVPPPARLSCPLPPSGLRVRVRAGVSAHACLRARMFARAWAPLSPLSTTLDRSRP